MDRTLNLIVTVVYLLLFSSTSYGGKNEVHFKSLDMIKNVSALIPTYHRNLKLYKFRKLTQIATDRVIVEDSSWTKVSTSDVFPYNVDNNPLQLRRRGRSDSSDQLHLYLYKSQQTYIGSLIIRYSVSLLAWFIEVLVSRLNLNVKISSSRKYSRLRIKINVMENIRSFSVLRF